MQVSGGITREQLTALVGWCAHEGVRLGVLFGSRALGRAHPQSDYDLALQPAPAPLRRLTWQMALEDRLGGDVDIVMLTVDTEPILGWEIACNGQLIYEAHPGLWAAERARLWHRYNDALPFRRGLAESLRRYAEEQRRAP